MAAPALRMAWLLRAVAWCAVIASVLGIVIVPGMHGTYSSAVVERFDSASLIFSYGMGVLLLLAAVLGAWDFSRLREVHILARIATMTSGIVVVGLFLPACATKLPPLGSALLVVSATTISVVGAIVGSRQAHTRAAAIALGIFAGSALVHLLAWHVANLGATRASTTLWDFSRGISTAAVLLDAAGQMVVAAWLGTRIHPKLGTWGGQIASAIALALAFGIVWGASRGGSETASPWQAMLHASLADAMVSPPPWGLGAISTFLGVAALMLAGAISVQPYAVGAVTAVLTLILVAHGGFDAPLRALAVTVASIWLMVTSIDQRAMWRSITKPTA
jgi:hypothetical protein